MIWIEVIAAVALGIVAVWAIAYPLFRRSRSRAPALIPEEPPPEETARGQALLAIRDLDFDYATGKVAEDDYRSLRDGLLRTAADLLEAESVASSSDQAEVLVAERRRLLEGAGSPESPRCPDCGPRPEPDARFCSSCGQVVVTGVGCAGCGAPLEAGARFCAHCGHAAA